MCGIVIIYFFFFKQKTAYEMRISDWSSDVCSSDLGLDREVLRAFGIADAPAPDMAQWSDIMDRYANPEGEVTIGVVGKYVGLPDAYKSLHEALVHGGLANRVKVNIRWLDAEMFENEDHLVDRKSTRLNSSH